MSYNPNGSRKHRRMKPPVYAPVDLTKNKQHITLRLSHTITPEGWGTSNHYTAAVTAWKTRS